MKIGERFQIPRDQHGRPVLEFDTKKREYIPDKLQWFEVTEISEDGLTIKAKPVWL